jgi:hypothetical protein
MRLRYLLPVVLLLQFGSISSAVSRSLDGCPEPKDLASELAKLRERGWKVWTPEELLKVWPGPLEPIDCQSSQGTCVQLGHQGRGDKDSCSCCETFDFRSEVERTGNTQEYLSAVIVFYSAHRYADVLAAARLLAKTMGLPDTEGPVAQDQPPPRPLWQSFDWKDTAEWITVLDLQISHGKAWTVYIAVGWHYLEPPAKPRSRPICCDDGCGDAESETKRLQGGTSEN